MTRTKTQRKHSTAAILIAFMGLTHGALADGGGMIPARQSPSHKLLVVRADVPPAEKENPGIDPVKTTAMLPSVFGSVAIPIRNFPASNRWALVFQAIGKCGEACGGDDVLSEVVGYAQGRGFREKLTSVNSGVNRMIAYRRDQAVYGRLDHWAKPAEIVSRGAGDCEDFAILKMAALMKLGIPARSMSLVVLQDQRRGVAHAVLSVTTGSGNFILDNLRNAVVLDRDLPGYLPLFSFSADRAWIHGSRSGGTRLVEATKSLASIAPGEGPDLMRTEDHSAAFAGRLFP